MLVATQIIVERFFSKKTSNHKMMFNSIKIEILSNKFHSFSFKKILFMQSHEVPFNLKQSIYVLLVEKIKKLQNSSKKYK